MNRRSAGRACLALGGIAVGVALIFAFLPGNPQTCGSLLVPAFPPGVGVACVRAQSTWFLAVAVACVTAMVLLGAGAALLPSRHRR